MNGVSLAKGIAAIVLLTVACEARASSREDVLARLEQVAASPNYYWAWTYPWPWRCWTTTSAPPLPRA